MLDLIYDASFFKLTFPHENIYLSLASKKGGSDRNEMEMELK